MHTLAMTKVWEVGRHPDAGLSEGPGAFRQHDIQAFPGGMRPPDWPAVPALMTDWVRRAAELHATAEPFPEALARLHADFERIHPFLDGNGRAGRLVTNLLLIRSGYPPAIIRKGDRARYLRTLQQADVGDPGPLGEFLARAISDTLLRFIVPARGRGAGSAAGPAGHARPVAEQPALGGRVPERPLPAGTDEPLTAAERHRDPRERCPYSVDVVGSGAMEVSALSAPRPRPSARCAPRQRPCR